MFNRGHWKQFEDTPAGPRIPVKNKNGVPSYSIDGANEQNFSTDFLADKTVEFINANKNQPFCYMLSLPDPHGPDTVRPPYDTMFQDQTYTQPPSALKDETGLPSWGKKEGGQFNMSKYYGMVKCIDDNVGKILDTLRRNNQLDNTIVVFTSDHGDLRGEHHRHNKGVPYEASARIPFIIYHKGVIKPRTVVTQALTTVDFQPTILNLMNAPLSGREQGRDASALLAGKKTDWIDINFMRSTSQSSRDGRGWIAVLTDRYKLVYSPKDMPWLFDLDHDPDELVNFFTRSEYRQTIRTLSIALLDYAKHHNDPYLKDPRVQADVQWAVHGSGPYKTPKLTAAKSAKKKKNK